MQGSEGCVVVGIEEPTRLSFTWNFPPTLPTIRNQHTLVTLTFAPSDDSHTSVTLTQDGFRDDGEWPDGRAYFDRAWDMVLSQLQGYFSPSTA